jgi:YfiH family protein
VGVEPGSLVAGAQVLGNAVAWVTEADRGRGAADLASALPDTDALITDSRGVALITFSADCPLVALVAPRRRAIGVAHASRRGTLGQVAARTVRAMTRLLGCDPGEMIAAIAPSIGPCCYEVGEDVMQAVRGAFAPADGLLLPAADPTKAYFNLAAANERWLVAAGVGQIEVAGICTACRTDEFFSYRREHGKTGHFGLLVGLSAPS